MFSIIFAWVFFLLIFRLISANINWKVLKDSPRKNMQNTKHFYGGSISESFSISPKMCQIDLDLTIMIWSWPKWNGHDQNELVRSKLWFSTKMNHIWTWPIHFGCDHFILVVTISFWLWPFHFGRDQIIMVKSKSIWSDQNHFGSTKTVVVT